MFPHYFQVVKVAEVEVVTMTATMVESTVMITMIWTLDLHLAVPHLVVLVEIGLFVSLFKSWIYFRVFWGYMDITWMQNVWHRSKNVIMFGFIKILTHPC